MKKLRAVFSIFSLCAMMVWPLHALSQNAAQVLNYRDADLRAFIEDVALETKKTFILDPEVRGKVNLISSEPIEGPLFFETFLSVLKVNGLTIVPTANGAYKITKNAKAVRDGGLVNQPVQGDRLMTRVFTIKHTDPLAIQAALKPYIFKGGYLFARNGLPIIIVTDFADNLLKIAEIIRNIDVDKSVIHSLKLHHTSAVEMADVAEQLTLQAGFEDNTRRFLKAIPVSGSNTLILKGLPEVLAQYEPILKDIDQNNASRGSLSVIKLKYASAEEMLPMIEKIAASLGPRGAKDKNGPASDVTISAYKGKNAIIINADPEVQKRLRDVIHSLDIPRAQVLVEAIVVEVSENAAKELGLQYILAGGNSSNIPFTVANYSNTAPNLLAATGAMVVDDNGDDASSVSGLLKAAAVDSFLGLNGLAMGAAGRMSNGGVFGVVLNALAADSDSNILSTPSILTLDNESARFLAGQEIPVTTGEALGNANTNPFRTIERKNVGIQLEVTPQINDDNEIRLNIRQEVSSISGTVSASSSELITNKNEVETIVRARDGEVVVLGGLIQENERISVEKIPLLGDIPGLGRLFRSDAKIREKTNLMIFLRPTIIRDAQDMEQLTRHKYDYIKNRQKLSGSELSVDDMMQSVLGVVPEAPEKAGE